MAILPGLEPQAGKYYAHIQSPGNHGPGGTGAYWKPLTT
jgi:hypothetical protein